MLSRRVRLPLSGLILAIALPGTAGAQRLSVPYTAGGTSPTSALSPPDPADRTAAMVGGGILGGAVGLAGGVIIGAGIERSLSGCQGDDFCGLGGAALGGLIGEATLLALGVHIGNERRGEYLAALGGSLGAIVAGFAVGGLVHRGDVVLVIPLGQLFAAATFERRSMPRPTPGR